MEEKLIKLQNILNDQRSFLLTRDQLEEARRLIREILQKIQEGKKDD